MTQDSPTPSAGSSGHTSREPSQARRALWQRVVSAQESGLVVVIALMMALLTIFGGSKPSPIRVDIPAGAQAAELEGNVLEITGPGGKSVFRSEQAWRIRDGDAEGSRVAFGSRTVNKFLDTENLVIVTTNASYIAIMAVGMTAVIILAGIDLSIGSIYAIAAILGAMAVSYMESSAQAAGGTSGTLAAVLVLLGVCGSVGAFCGFLNGAGSVALRVHPFIITLGTMAIYRGVVFVLTKGQTVSGIPESIQRGFFKFEFAHVYPVPTLIMLGVALIGMFVLSQTVLGRRVYAIGGNEVAAKYAGIPVGRVKTIVYTLSGLLAGLSAAIYVGYYGAAETNAGQGYELNVIAAAVIGGASLSGGRGSALGAVLGAILVQLINNGMVILVIDQSFNQIVMGLAIILAVVVDQTKTRLSAR